ncbi:MAG: hypothetical protein ABFR19_07785 [Pseudomonadota bacterium]
MSDEKRTLYMSIYYVNGETQTFEYEQQLPDHAISGRIDDVLNSGYLMFESEEILTVIPLTNVLRVDIAPVPDALPETVIKNVKFHS